MLDVNPSTLTGDELTAHVRALEELERRVERAKTATLLEWDRQQVWADDGSLTPGARLARETGMAASTARERMRVTTKLSTMPFVRAASDGGRLSWSKVRLLAAACNERTAKAFELDEEDLVAQAERLTVEQLAIYLRHWRYDVDHDGALTDIDSMHDRAFFQCAASWDGEVFVKGRVDPETGAVVRGAIDSIIDELWRSERADMNAAVDRGDAPASPRRRSQLAADALGEMARRAMANTDAAASGRSVSPARPLIGITIDARGDRLHGWLANGTPLAPDDLGEWLCDASVFRVVLGAGSIPIDLGRTVRSPTEAQRRAASTVWRTCAFPGCELSFAWCQLHHLVHWTKDGPTDIANLVPLCRRHHRAHHRNVFGIQRLDSGVIRFTTPDGRHIGDANPTMHELLAPLRN